MSELAALRHWQDQGQDCQMDCPDAVLEEPGSRDGHSGSEEDGSFAVSVLRTVKLPSDLVSSFLHHAKDSSDNGIETLGLLGGRLGRDSKFRVTHLLLPKQTGQDDSCSMEGLRMCWRLSIRTTLSSFSRTITILSLPCRRSVSVKSRMLPRVSITT